MDHVLKDMIDRREAAEQKGREIAARATNENRGLTTTEKSQRDAYIDETLALDKQIREYRAEIERERAAVEAELRGGSLRELGVRSFAVTGDGGRLPILTPEQRMASTLPHAAREEASRMSLGRAVIGMITGDWRGAEAEQRAMSSGSLTAGGVMVPTSIAVQIVDLARARSVMIAAGARTMPMPTQEVTVARVISDPSANWVGENVEIPESDGTFGGYLMKAQKLAAITRMSIELAQDAPNAAQIVEAQLAASLGLALDRAGLRGVGAGVGSGQEPLGVRNWDGVQLYPTSATPGWTHLAEAVRRIRLQNGPDRGLGIIYSPTTAYFFDIAVDDTAGWLAPPGVVSPERNPHFVTTQIPENLGAGSNETEIYVGDFRNVIIGMRSEVMLEVSRESDNAFKKGQVVIRAYLRADVAVTYPAHHVVLTGVSTSGG